MIKLELDSNSLGPQSCIAIGEALQVMLCSLMLSSPSVPFTTGVHPSSR
jgi:hypothetical protein